MSFSPDSVCKKFAKKKAKITIRPLEEDGSSILLEGDREGLEFLGRLLLAQARSRRDCGFQLNPQGAGKSFFTKGSHCGLYIHRLHSPAEKARPSAGAVRTRKKGTAAS